MADIVFVHSLDIVEACDNIHIYSSIVASC